MLSFQLPTVTSQRPKKKVDDAMGKLRALEKLFLSSDSNSFGFLGWGGRYERVLPISQHVSHFLLFLQSTCSSRTLKHPALCHPQLAGHQSREFSTSSQTALQIHPHLPGTAQAFLILHLHAYLCPAIPFSLPPRVSSMIPTYPT